jgi:hypothetical protein
MYKMPFLSFDGADIIATCPSIKKKVCHDDTLTHPNTNVGKKKKKKKKKNNNKNKKLLNQI